MNDKKVNKDIQDYLIEKTIINMYRKGYSINFIVKKFYKYKNKNSKPIFINGEKFFPPKIYTMTYCRMCVTEIIYKYNTDAYLNELINF